MTGSAEAVAIGVMALVTYATRIAGIYLVALLPTFRSFERIAHIASGSVLAAIIGAALTTGDPGRTMGIAGAALLMLWLRRPFVAMGGGTLLTIAIRLAESVQ